jgi:hypothetical protein
VATRRVLQVVRHGLRVPLQVTDVRGQLPDCRAPEPDAADAPHADAAHAAVAAVLREESSRPYDLAEGPLFTPRLLTLADDDHVLVLGLHHIITDAHSAGILAADLEELYKAAVEGRPARFAAPAGSTVGAAEPDRDPADLEWWRRYLDPLPPVPALPTRRPRGRRVAGGGAAAEIRLDGVRTAEAAGVERPTGRHALRHAPHRLAAGAARALGPGRVRRGLDLRAPHPGDRRHGGIPRRAPSAAGHAHGVDTADRRRTGHPGRAVRGGRPSTRRPGRAPRRRQPRPRQPAPAGHRLGGPGHRPAGRDPAAWAVRRSGRRRLRIGAAGDGVDGRPHGFGAAAAHPLRRRSLRRGDGTGLSGRPRPDPGRHGVGRGGARTGHRRPGRSPRSGPGRDRSRGHVRPVGPLRPGDTPYRLEVGPRRRRRGRRLQLLRSQRQFDRGDQARQPRTRRAARGHRPRGLLRGRDPGRDGTSTGRADPRSPPT